MSVDVDRIVVEDRIDEIEKKEAGQGHDPVEILVEWCPLLLGRFFLLFLRDLGGVLAAHKANIESEPSGGKFFLTLGKPAAGKTRYRAARTKKIGTLARTPPELSA